LVGVWKSVWVPDLDYSPTPVRQAPPIMIGGAGDKVLAMAAREADIVSVPTFGTEAALAQRIQYVEDQARQRREHIQLSFSFGQVLWTIPATWRS
jgi:alkanesulfonate monooxygenase SsuD/methylene tetrahydromethanopterin reductase-like flavin-dependent oxidoreductase (luciferase family)